MSTEIPDVRVKGGVVRGRIDHGTPAYLGIPYAAPPFGGHRMRPPRPAEPWDGVRDATAYGPTAPKSDFPPSLRQFFADPAVPGDDCLNLNVWTPDPAADGLPVLVWIHGGSFTSGSGSVVGCRGSAFARDGVVCVTINYRLQAEGFLHTGDDGSNVGLLDQIAALEWVRDNIASFGGDPAKVTVAGQSAGAMSIAALLAMPTAEGLFRGAITQSGAAWHTLDARTGLRVAGLLAAELGVAPERAAIAAVPPGRVLAATERVAAAIGSPAEWGHVAVTGLPFAPVVDGTVLPRHPLDAIADGASRGVALLTGTTAEEARLPLVASGAITHLDEAAAVAGAARFGVHAATVAAACAKPGVSPGDVLAAIVTEHAYTRPAVQLAEARGADAPTWMYRFDHRSAAAGGLLGAAHAVDIPFVFDTMDTPDGALLMGGRTAPEAAAVVHAAWVRFVSDLDPGWAPYRPGTRTTMVFGPRTGTIDLAARGTG
ncbi:carboxylesterase/lipase family protein [Catenuloplanes indicus]|uniref:Carboxylic ester hydrolase n=1 Tax=Catenuloplanes indicus TaxID=137267 RepID=A0AAE3VTT4_9ACTN|nr:carboxylesterase family protein [Catenuloplanes indicus]MDQ0363530.1 para-nitrobenzyl esterase [Catenuloplanes indicus]